MSLPTWDCRGTAVYAASKGAIDAATRVLASELPPKKIRVKSVNPGLVVTPATEAVGFTTGDAAQFWINAAALRRPGLPSDIAPVVLFLASPESAWLERLRRITNTLRPISGTRTSQGHSSPQTLLSRKPVFTAKSTVRARRVLTPHAGDVCPPIPRVLTLPVAR